MAEETRIEWADHTFNPWIGCTKVSPACDHCYAEAQASRYWPGEQLWAGNRKRTSENNWRQPLKWNRQAAEFRAQHGRPPMVFCASLADVFDNQVPEQWRRDLWALIDATPNLIWLLLTKRPQNIRKMLPANYIGLTDRGWPAWPNVWFGTTVENQAEADRRIPHLLAAPAAKRFLSCEPLLGPVDLSSLMYHPCPNFADTMMDPETGAYECCEKCDYAGIGDEAAIDWVIAGGESGREARPSHPDWFRSLRDQCSAAGVPFLFKQWGEWIEHRHHVDGPDVITLTEGTCDADAELEKCVKPGFLTASGAFAWSLDDIPENEARVMDRVGKKLAGRMLDGIIHDARPDALPVSQPPVTGREKRSLT